MISPLQFCLVEIVAFVPWVTSNKNGGRRSGEPVMAASLTH